jgi:hypothetical protein
MNDYGKGCWGGVLYWEWRDLLEKGLGHISKCRERTKLERETAMLVGRGLDRDGREGKGAVRMSGSGV